jgi:hypothetical protein
LTSTRGPLIETVPEIADCELAETRCPLNRSRLIA